MCICMCLYALTPIHTYVVQSLPYARFEDLSFLLKVIKGMPQTKGITGLTGYLNMPDIHLSA